jgi:hypothetical protein
MTWNEHWGFHVLQNDSQALSRRQKLDLVSRMLRRFRLTDDDGLSALFLSRKLPTPELIVRHLRKCAVLLPPSITPEFVAESILATFREATPTPTEPLEISCWDIDQFRPFKDVVTRDVTLPLIVPERVIKERLNALLGECESAGDWGGEDNDIFATCSVNGRELPIAMMLKGPSVPRPMRIKDTGANSDQVLRVTEAPAAVFVVQHVHKITEAVRRQLRMNVEALRSRGVEAYCAFIDGVQTYKLLSDLPGL